MTAGKTAREFFMMKKSKILIVALIGLLMAGGLVLAGCDDDSKKPCSTGGNCYVSGISVSGNWCKESRCAVSKAGSGPSSCDCK
jgi:hypothetical protein